MRRLQGHPKRGPLQGLLVLLFISGCTGVLNDPSVRKGSTDLALDDDMTLNYLWGTKTDKEDIKGNRKEITISGSCGSDIPTINVDVAPLDALNSGSLNVEDKSIPNSIHFEATCTDQKFAATFSGDNKFNTNGIYQVRFRGTTKDKAQPQVRTVMRVYNLYAVDNPATMVGLKCMDAVSSTQIPFQNIDECTIEKAQNLRLDGLCTDDATVHQTSVKVKDTTYTCQNFSADFATLYTGAHLIPVTSLDLWGNTYTFNLLAKKLDILSWEDGGVSFVSSGTFLPTQNVKLEITAAVGTAYVPEMSDISNPVPFARQPAGSSLTMAPGFLNLIFGLSDGG